MLSFTTLSSPGMPPKKKRPTLPESDGEEFSDVSSSSDTNTEDELAEDTWVFPVVALQAKRGEYEAVCE